LTFDKAWIRGIIPGMFRVVRGLTWPFRIAREAMERRRLRRALPNVRRRLINLPNGVRTESNAEYLDRLRDIYAERFGER